MRSERLQDAIGEVRDDYLEDARQSIDPAAISRRKRYRFIRYGSMAAGLCVLVGSVLFWQNGKETADISMTGSMNSIESAAEDNAMGAVAEENAVSSEPGIYVPEIELPDEEELKTALMPMDMIGLIVYKGAIYTQSECYYENQGGIPEKLISKKIGYAKGTINEWSTQDDYAEELASTFEGDVYTVKGYDPKFRLCIRHDPADEEDGTTVMFLDHLNGITLYRGADLFENRLHISGNIDRILWQSHEDWNEAKEVCREVDTAEEEELWKNFFGELNEALFVCMIDEEAMQTGGETIYDTSEQAHIRLQMDDGTIIRLRLFEGGYVGYEPLGWYFVYMPGDPFDAVFRACKE